jgi:hypothetical protein
LRHGAVFGADAITVGLLQVFDPAGGAAVAEATRTFGNGVILSSVFEPGLEDG